MANQPFVPGKSQYFLEFRPDLKMFSQPQCHIILYESCRQPPRGGSVSVHDLSCSHQRTKLFTYNRNRSGSNPFHARGKGQLY